MRSLPHPTFGVERVIETLGDGDRHRRVKNLGSFLATVEADYIRRSNPLMLWEMPHNDPVLDQLVDPKKPSRTAADDVRYAYQSALSDRRGRARLLYNELRTAPYNRCPICLQREVAALDHYLPKDRWASVSITPLNLYPICTACNSRKLERYASAAHDQLLHPYFDDLGDMSWIVADIIEAPGAPLVYRVEAPGDWSEELSARVEKHFEFYGLADLFQDNSANLLASNALMLGLTADAGGPAAVEKLLSELGASYRHRSIDLWTAVAFETWAASTWFCQGGWKEDLQA